MSIFLNSSVKSSTVRAVKLTTVCEKELRLLVSRRSTFSAPDRLSPVMTCRILSRRMCAENINVALSKAEMHGALGETRTPTSEDNRF